MLDQNTDRMWYVIGAIIIGGLILTSSIVLFTDVAFGGVVDVFESYSDYDNSWVGSGQKVFTMDKITPRVDDGLFEKVSESSIKFGSNSRHKGGVVIPTEYFKYGETYKVSFDLTVMDGSVEGIGGHLFFTDDVNILIDGVKPDIWEKGAIIEIESDDGVNLNSINDWSLGVVFPNTRGKEHHVELTFKRNIKKENIVMSGDDFHIQPNRTRGSQWPLNALPYTVLLENLIIEELDQK